MSYKTENPFLSQLVSEKVYNREMTNKILSMAKNGKVERPDLFTLQISCKGQEMIKLYAKDYGMNDGFMSYVIWGNSEVFDSTSHFDSPAHLCFKRVEKIYNRQR